MIPEQEIRDAHASGASIYSLSRQYCLTRNRVQHIVSGSTRPFIVRRKPGDMPPPPPLVVRPRYFIGAIIEHAAEIWNVTPAEIVGRDRYARINGIRGAVIVIARELTELSTPQIGVVLGGRDHSTVINAADRCKELAERDPLYAINLNELRAHTMNQPGNAAQLAEARKREIEKQEAERAEREAAIIAEREARRAWLKAANGNKIKAAILRRRHQIVTAVQTSVKAKNNFTEHDNYDGAHVFHAMMAEGSAKLLAKLREVQAA
jgi:hypothetical protein